MATESYIQNLIDTNLADDSDILPSEHRAVEDALLGEFFPDSVKIEWNGTSAVDPIADIVCSTATLPSSKCQFQILFTKIGNRVFYKGAMGAFGSSLQINNAQLATFATELYKPLNNLSSRSIIISDGSSNVVPNVIILFDRTQGIKIQGGITQGIVSLHFEGSYKVAN